MLQILSCPQGIFIVSVRPANHNHIIIICLSTITTGLSPSNAALLSAFQFHDTTLPYFSLIFLLQHWNAAAMERTAWGWSYTCNFQKYWTVSFCCFPQAWPACLCSSAEMGLLLVLHSGKVELGVWMEKGSPRLEIRQLEPNSTEGRGGQDHSLQHGVLHACNRELVVSLKAGSWFPPQCQT